MLIVREALWCLVVSWHDITDLSWICGHLQSDVASFCWPARILGYSSADVVGMCFCLCMRMGFKVFERVFGLSPLELPDSAGLSLLNTLLVVSSLCNPP